MKPRFSDKPSAPIPLPGSRSQAERASAMLQMIRTGALRTEAAMSSGDFFHSLGNLIDDASDPKTSDGSLTTHLIGRLKAALVAFRESSLAAENTSLTVAAVLEQLPRL